MRYEPTGRPCRECRGNGWVVDDYGQQMMCEGCGGSGDEYAELPDEPTIKEPEE